MHKQQKSFTDEEKLRISKLLNKKLAPEYISYRPGFNRNMIAYVEGWTIISLANQIFGYNGWSSRIKKMDIDYCDTIDGRFSVGITCYTAVTLKDGTKKEDVGFGSAENQRSKSQAYEKARKEAATDALKRTLRQFGNALGNCCYDKQFLEGVKKIEKKNRDIVEAKDLYRNDYNQEKLEKVKVDEDNAPRQKIINFTKASTIAKAYVEEINHKNTEKDDSSLEIDIFSLSTNV